MEAELQHKYYFSIMEAEIERIEIILSELLVLAKPQDIKFKQEKLKLLIEDVTTLFDSQAIINNVQIEVNYDFQNVIMKCDKNQIKQVFINFLKNAIEAMPNGGTITIEGKYYNDEKVKILIKDTGLGMPLEILKKIGQPFFTTKEGGTGLGVMISKQIIENHNGSVNFWSDKKGTMIEIILPISLVAI